MHHYSCNVRQSCGFLAGGWSVAPKGPLAWGLCYKEELSPDSLYCEPSYKYPCVPGISYHGRGAMPVYWYCSNFSCPVLHCLKVIKDIVAWVLKFFTSICSFIRSFSSWAIYRGLSFNGSVACFLFMCMSFNSIIKI